MTGPDGIRAAIADVLNDGSDDQGWPADRADECRWCGRRDGELLHLLHDGTDRAVGHDDCGEAQGYRPVPSCTGLADSCGARAGQPCEPGCPSLAADSDGLR